MHRNTLKTKVTYSKCNIKVAEQQNQPFFLGAITFDIDTKEMSSYFLFNKYFGHFKFAMKHLSAILIVAAILTVAAILIAPTVILISIIQIKKGAMVYLSQRTKSVPTKFEDSQMKNEAFKGWPWFSVRKDKNSRRLSYFQSRNYLCNDSSLGFSKFFPLSSGKPFQILWLVLILNHLGIRSTTFKQTNIFVIKSNEIFQILYFSTPIVHIF